MGIMRPPLFLCVSLMLWGCSSASRPCTSSRCLGPNKMLAIVLGGFRWDYIHRDCFKKIRSWSVHPKWLQPVFPAHTTTNSESLATGLYAESHGILGLDFYSYERDEIFTVQDPSTYANPVWWPAEPSWITATKQGRKRSVYGTVRCSFPYDGVLPAKCQGMDVQYDPSFTTFRDNIESAIDDLKGDFGAASIYTPQMDIGSFIFGPDSPEIEHGIKTVANILNLAKEKLKKYGLQDKVNVLVTADAGKTAVNSQSHKFTRVEDYLNLDDVRYLLGGGGFLKIITMEGKTEDVYADLQPMPGVTAYKRGDIPVWLHYKDNINTPDILLIADKDYFIETVVNNTKHTPNLPDYQENYPGTRGFNGYLPGEVEDMNSAMLAWGPDFDVGPFDVELPIVDVYGLSAHLLDVEPLPNNGSLSDISVLLQPSPGPKGPFMCECDLQPGAKYTDCVLPEGKGGKGGKQDEAICIECCVPVTHNSTEPRTYNFAGAEFVRRWKLTITALSLGMNEKLIIKKFHCYGEGCKWLELDNSIPTPFTVHMHRSSFVMKSSDPDGSVTFKADCRGCS